MVRIIWEQITLAGNPSKVALVYSSAVSFLFLQLLLGPGKENGGFLLRRGLCYDSEQTSAQADHILVFIKVVLFHL